MEITSGILVKTVSIHLSYWISCTPVPSDQIEDTGGISIAKTVQHGIRQLCPSLDFTQSEG